jgi:GTP-binding protein YchF
MALTVGIIGLPQAGKTSLFNALTRAGAPISGYPTSTVQANLAVVPVPDERLHHLAAIFHPKKVTPTTVEFVDVAGLGQETNKQEGLSAEFLGHIRNADALAIVVRCFDNPQAPHPAGSVDAARDMDELQAELALTDLATIERRIERTARAAKSGDKKLLAELETLRRLQEALNAGQSVRELDLDAHDEALVTGELFLLTAKPRLYVANVSEDALAEATPLLERIATDAGADLPPDGELREVAQVGLRARAEGAEAIAVSARLEAELNELPPEDATEYLEALGLPQLGADRVIQAGYHLLNLITFLTAGEPEVRAWTVTRGTKAPQAAGKIHSDIERGFIRAEVTPYPDLIACGSFAAARERGLLRLEGKDYVVQDGDVIYFRFNVSNR